MIKKDFIYDFQFYFIFRPSIILNNFSLTTNNIHCFGDLSPSYAKATRCHSC